MRSIPEELNKTYPYIFEGYPILSHLTEKKQSNQGGFNLGGINATGQIPDLPGNYGLIDKDTPREAYTFKSYVDNQELVLVFSDEFNQDGRTFYPGDDPFWEAVDLHYWVTVSAQNGVYLLKFKSYPKNDLEWYDPQQGARSVCYPPKSLFFETWSISHN